MTAYVPPYSSSLPDWQRQVATAVNPLLQAPQKTYIDTLQGITVGSGATSAQRDQNTATINASLSQGLQLGLRAGSVVEIGSSLFPASNSAIIGDTNGPKPIIYMPAAKFNNVVNTVVSGTAPNTRYGSNAVAINFSAANNVILNNFVIQSETTIGRYLRGIVGIGVSGAQIIDVEIFGIPTGIGIALSSATSCSIIRPHIHDFTDSTNWASHPQLTGIEFDNDVVSGASFACSVFDPYIHDLTVSGSLLSTWGYETDGINIANNGARVRIIGGRIDHVGEGIDTFGSGGVIEGIELNNCYNFGLKLIHGASRNVVNNVSITNPGAAGLLFAGTNVATQYIEGNVVTGLVVQNVDANGVWAASDTAGILFQNNSATTYYPFRNQVIGAYVDQGANGKYGWLDSCNGTDNYGDNIFVKVGASNLRRVLVSAGGGSVRLAGTVTYATNVV